VPGADTQVSPFLMRVTSNEKLQDKGKSSLKFFELESGKEVKELDLDLKLVDRFKMNDKSILILDALQGVAILDEDLKDVEKIDIPDHHLNDISFSKSNKLALVTTDNEVVILIDLEKKKIIRKIFSDVVKCEESCIYLEEQKKFIVAFETENSDNIMLGILAIE